MNSILSLPTVTQKIKCQGDPDAKTKIDGQHQTTGNALVKGRMRWGNDHGLNL